MAKRPVKKAMTASGFDPASQPATPKFKEIGVIGQRISTGYVWEEFLPQLRGEQGRRIYQEMSNNDATVGAVLNSISLIIRGVDWKGIPADDSVKAEKEAEFAESLMKDMSHSWEDHISEALTMLVYGWSYFEMVLKRRVGPLEKSPEKRSRFDDGRIGIRKMAPRAQDTLSRWEIQDDGGIDGMWQMPITGRVGILYLPIERCVLYRTTARKNSPEGVSVLRTAYKSWYDLKNMEQYEAIGVERELAGLPVVRIPGELFSSTDPADIAVRSLYEKVARDLKFNEQGGLLIPSDTFEDISGSPSSIPKVQIELLSSAGARTIDTDTIIQRKQRGIARACLADFLMLGEGSGTSRGSYGMSESKMDFFIRACESILAQIAFPLNNFVLPRIFDMNGIDRKLMPKLEPGRLVKADLEKIGKFLQTMAAAGAPLFPDDELENQLRREADLPEKSPEAIAQQKDQQKLDAEMAQHQATGAALDNKDKEKSINASPPEPGKGHPPFGAVKKVDWDESQHPRGADGKFTDGASATHVASRLSIGEQNVLHMSSKGFTTTSDYDKKILAGLQDRGLVQAGGGDTYNTTPLGQQVNDENDRLHFSQAANTAPSKAKSTKPGKFHSPPPEYQDSPTGEKLDYGDVKAVSSYIKTGNNYVGLNKYLREGVGGTAKRMETIDALDSAMFKASVSEDVTAYRGVGGTVGEVEGSTASLFEHLKVGDTLRDKAFVSYSGDKEIAEQFTAGGEHMFRISLKKGDRGIDVNTLGIKGAKAHEREIILPRESSFKVVAIHEPTGFDRDYTLVDLELG